MAVTEAALTSGSDVVAGSSAATASITPTANSLILLSVGAHPAGANKQPTATGNGLTWVVEKHNSYDDASSGNGITEFRAMGASPSAGAITIDFAGESQLEITWSVREFAGVDTTGTDGSAAVVQSVNGSGTGTAMLSTLAAFGSSSNATSGAFMCAAAFGTATPGGGFSEIHDISTALSVHQTEWRNDNDTTVDATSSASAAWGAIALEIKAAAAKTVIAPMQYPRRVFISV